MRTVNKQFRYHKSRKRKGLDENKMSYGGYLSAGHHWKHIKDKSSILYGDRCIVCDSPEEINRHHLAYGEEHKDTLPHHIVPLCKTCHETYHANAYSGGIYISKLRKNDSYMVLMDLYDIVCNARGFTKSRYAMDLIGSRKHNVLKTFHTMKEYYKNGRSGRW